MHPQWGMSASPTIFSFSFFDQFITDYLTLSYDPILPIVKAHKCPFFELSCASM